MARRKKRGIKDMIEIKFDKMEGLGNDYVYLTCMESLPEDMPRLAREISDRHFGVGGDGMVVITRSNVADFRMIMYNSDGSEAQMCGNASRCIARLVYEKGLASKHEFTLETLAGIKHLTLNFKNGKIANVSVNMGKPCLKAEEIPTAVAETTLPFPIHKIKAGNELLAVHCVGMGNPHGVIFTHVDDDFFMKYGPLLETHPIWPEKANIEFVRIVDRNNIEMRVWERGTGETLACGTGACASAVAAILTDKTDNELNVRMKGGTLNIRLNPSGEVIMTGDATLVASGTYYYNPDKSR